MNRFLRGFSLVGHLLFVALMVVLTTRVVLMATLANPGGAVTFTVTLQQVLNAAFPALLVAIASLVAAFPLIFRNTSNMLLERRVFPLLLLLYTFNGIKLIQLYFLIQSFTPISPRALAIVYQWAFLLSALLAMLIGLFQRGFNLMRPTMAIFLATTSSLFVSVLSSPVANAALITTYGVSLSKPLAVATAVAALIAVICFLAILQEERTRHNIFRCLGFMLLIISGYLLFLPLPLIATSVATVAYISGIFMVSPLLHSNRMRIRYNPFNSN